MRNKILLPLLFAAFSASFLSAQSTAFGLKGGLLLGVQKWNSFEQDPLIKYHGIAFIENADETAQFSVFAQAGYHLKGSALRNRNFFSPISGQYFRPPAQEFIFKNIALTLGAKRKYEFSALTKAYYLFGLRGDYTIGTNLDKYKEINELNNSLYFPDDRFVRKLNYGATLGGGFEFAFGELVGALLEFTLNPDFSFQYRQPTIPNVTDPFTGQQRSIPERTIRNITFEVSAGFRLLRKVEYID
jgi:hypothetical protein